MKTIQYFCDCCEKEMVNEAFQEFSLCGYKKEICSSCAHAISRFTATLKKDTTHDQ